ncbi:Uncharacterised protein [Mycoplasmopsis bovigenitalium]|uniref:Uncharacterized protein n=1 Tax=Mycoplasmopsis bovigenitalium TaxID=2112 RepID=A0A449A8U9_9BACT|nr:hypothetical protein [Mycoplasmopsis bovigenitalium]VEU60695.1 Uncharacterised protein [Mycoplasmopsis bovigenitalium]
MKLTKLLLTSTTTILPALTLVSAKASNVKKEVNNNSFGGLPNAIRNAQGRSANIMVTPPFYFYR